MGLCCVIATEQGLSEAHSTGWHHSGRVETVEFPIQHPVVETTAAEHLSMVRL